MAGAADVDGLNLSGAWRGLFSYPPERALESVSFTAEISDADGWLDGVTEEAATAGPLAGKTISACLSGHRSGRGVNFLKLYDRQDGGYDTVAYEGEVSGDGLEIEGRWSIPGSWSGRFLMIRSEGPALAIERQEARSV